MTNLYEVAKRAGVSPSTVSRTFNSPEMLSEQTTKRVLKAAQDVSYHPRRKIRKDNNGAFGTIGFQYFNADPSNPITMNPFYGPVFAGAMAESSSLGLHLLVHSTDRDQLSRELPRMVSERAVSGLLLVGGRETELIDTFAEYIPEIVLLDYRDEEEKYHSVISDGFGGAYRATRYLIDLGHKHIGFLTVPGYFSFRERLHGYYCALLEAGMGIQPDAVTILATAGNSDTVIGLLSRKDRPTALVAANDALATVVMDICGQMGLAIPNDLSIVGFDDVDFSARLPVPLTTVRVNKEYMGRLAVRRLRARILESVEGAISQPFCETVPVEFVERLSCKPVSHVGK